MKKDTARNATLLARVRRAIKRADAQARAKIRLLRLDFAQWLVLGKRQEIDVHTAIIDKTNEVVDHRRRQIFAALLTSGCLLPAMAQPALADTAFTNFAFLSQAGNLARTMPARLSDVKNVKEFGATGDGALLSARFGSGAPGLAAAQVVFPFVTSVDQTQDYAGMRAAIENLGWSVAPQGVGTIFFPPPPAAYVLSDSIDLAPVFGTNPGNRSICFIGSGNASRIQGNIAAYLIHCSSDSITGNNGFVSNIAFSNVHVAGGCFNTGFGIAWTFMNCSFGGHVGLDLTSPAAFSSQSMNVIGCNFTGGGPDIPISIGILSREGTAVIGCDLTGLTYAIVANLGLSVNSCRFEVNTVGITFGAIKSTLDALPPPTIVRSNGWGQCSVTSSTFESNGTGIDILGNGGVATFSGLGMHGGMDYGVRTRGRLQDATFISVNVNGSQDFAGFQLEHGDGDRNLVFINCHAANDQGAGAAWDLNADLKPGDVYFYGRCNIPFAPRYAFADLPQPGTGTASIVGKVMYVTATASVLAVGQEVGDGGVNVTNTKITSCGNSIVTSSAATDEITKVGHGYVADTKGRVSISPNGTLPAPLAANTDYFVSASGLGTDVFKLSATAGGAVINITGAAIGTLRWILQPATSSGQAGAYEVDVSQTVASQTMTFYGQHMVGGDEYDIVDCNTATFLATAAGGGTGATAFRKVRWNNVSHVWQVVG